MQGVTVMYDISVAIPTLNSIKTLEHTLFSLSRQNGCRVEVIVADSGSTDGTLSICERYSIPAIYVPPGNMYSAINAALSMCHSPWFCYLNSDDIVYPRSYARLIRYGEEQKADIVYGGCDFIDEEGRFLHSYLPGRPNELRSQFITSQLSFAQPASIFRKNVFERLNGFDEKYDLIADLDFFLQSVMIGCKFVMLEGKSVCGFRISHQQLSQQLEKMNAQNKQVREKYGKPTLKDLWLTGVWRFRNWPNYLIRILRHHTMVGRYRLVKTSDC
jgi:glycosyltransferase involved in cell wall biosynthesis